MCFVLFLFTLPFCWYVFFLVLFILCFIACLHMVRYTWFRLYICLFSFSHPFLSLFLLFFIFLFFLSSGYLRLLPSSPLRTFSSLSSSAFFAYTCASICRFYDCVSFSTLLLHRARCLSQCCYAFHYMFFFLWSMRMPTKFILFHSTTLVSHCCVP